MNPKVVEALERAFGTKRAENPVQMPKEIFALVRKLFQSGTRAVQTRVHTPLPDSHLSACSYLSACAVSSNPQLLEHANDMNDPDSPASVAAAALPGPMVDQDTETAFRDLTNASADVSVGF